MKSCTTTKSRIMTPERSHSRTRTKESEIWKCELCRVMLTSFLNMKYLDMLTSFQFLPTLTKTRTCFSPSWTKSDSVYSSQCLVWFTHWEYSRNTFSPGLTFLTVWLLHSWYNTTETAYFQYSCKLFPIESKICILFTGSDHISFFLFCDCIFELFPSRLCPSRFSCSIL